MDKNDMLAFHNIHEAMQSRVCRFSIVYLCLDAPERKAGDVSVSCSSCRYAFAFQIFFLFSLDALTTWVRLKAQNIFVTLIHIVGNKKIWLTFRIW